MSSSFLGNLVFFIWTLHGGIAQGTADADAASIFVLNEIYAHSRPLQALKNIQNDITVAIIQDIGHKPRIQPMEYFKGPDWPAINRRVYEILYG